MTQPRSRTVKNTTKKPVKPEKNKQSEPREYFPVLYSEQQVYFKVKHYTLLFKTGFRKLPSEVDPICTAIRLDGYWVAKTIFVLMWLLTKTNNN